MGSDWPAKSGSRLDEETGHLVSPGPRFALPFTFLQSGKWGFKNMYSGAQVDNTEGFKNYVSPFSRISTILTP